MWDLLFLLDSYMFLAGMCVSVAGFVFGGVLALITGRTNEEIIAISLETALQNSSIAFVLLRLTLPSPYSDVASMTPIAQMMMTSAIIGVLVLIVLGAKCRDYCMKDNRDEKDDDWGAVVLRRNHMQRVDHTGQQPLRPSYHGGRVTPEYSWAGNQNLIVPNSPTENIDPRIF